MHFSLESVVMPTGVLEKLLDVTLSPKWQSLWVCGNKI
jgi:hypothetical protein